MTSLNFQNYTNQIIMQDGCVATAIVKYSPYTVLKGETFSGSCVEILRIIMNKIGLCIKFLIPESQLFGAKHENGSWSGAVGMVLNKEVEIITCPLAANYDRSKVVGYSEPVFSSKYGIVYPRPGHTTSMTGLILPFTLYSWIGILFALLLITGVSVLINKLFYAKIKACTRADQKTLKYKDFLPTKIWFYGIISQPSLTFPKENGSRLLISVWLLMTLVLTIIFKSNLKAQLIVRKVTLPFDSLKEMVDQTVIKWSFLEDSIIQQAFKPAYFEDPHSVMGKAWSGKGELYKSVSQIENFVLQKNTACIELYEKIEEILSEDFSKTGHCRFATTRNTIIHSSITFGIRKGSILIPQFNRHLLHMKEMGIIDHILSKDFFNSTYCIAPPDKEDDVQLRPLTITDFLGPFFILFIGYALGILAFLLEVAHKHDERKKQRQDSKKIYLTNK